MDIGEAAWVVVLIFWATSIVGGLVLSRLGRRVGWRAVGMSAVAGGVGAVMVFTVSSLTGPTGEAAGQGVDAIDGAVHLPERAQAYIDESTRDLAERLEIKSDEVRLESVTEPAEVDGTYFTKLEAGGRVYECHGRDGIVLLVSEGLPLNSG